MPALSARTVSSPCSNKCALKEDVCIGCGRTLVEIANWIASTDAERRQIRANAKARLRELKS